MTSLVMYLVVLLGALAALPASSCLPFTIKTDDASIGFFRYGPSADAWRVCRVCFQHWRVIALLTYL